MTTKTVQGKEVRFWDFARQIEVEQDGVKTKVNQPDWVKNPVDVQISVPETLDEALTVAGQDEKRLLELVAKGIEAEAEEKAGSTPAGTFSVSMVAALDKALKVSPQFSGIKSSSERRKALMSWVSSTPGMKDVYLTAFEPLRNVKGDDED